ncbi:MAG: cysteine desulfurase [Deltaproteobacteria bacterium]|nr:cysteine desulfurase [Deltaproteobacteria bacterium]
MRRIYLDNNATTPVDERVLAAMMPYFSDFFGNPSSIHQTGQRARRGMDDARESLASALGVEPKSIVFTSGGSESNNAVVFGVADLHAGRPRHIVTTAIEHDSVRKTCARLEAEGVAVTYLAPNALGIVEADAVADAIRPETILVSVMAANNEVGTLQPIEQIARIARERGVLFHTDAVQRAGKMPVRPGEWDADFVTLCAHKLHGPKGIGLLYIRPGVELPPFVIGGKHERLRRAGTENVPGIVGFAESWRCCDEYLAVSPGRMAELRDRLAERIVESTLDVRVTTRLDLCTPNTLHVCVRGLDSESLLMNLDMLGVSASSGSACASGSHEISHVLAAMGVPEEWALGAVRFSLSRNTTEEEVDEAAVIFSDVVRSLRASRDNGDERAANSV